MLAGAAQAIPGQVGEGGVAIHGHDQVCLGEDAAQDVDDAVGAADGEAVGVGPADGDRGGAPMGAIKTGVGSLIPNSSTDRSRWTAPTNIRGIGPTAGTR